MGSQKIRLQQVEGVLDAQKTMSEDMEGVVGHQKAWLLRRIGGRAQPRPSHDREEKWEPSRSPAVR